MTEQEKMLSGLPYNGGDSALVQARNTCKDLCFTINQLQPSNTTLRHDLLRNLFGKTSSSFWIETPLMCDYGKNIEIGNDFYMNHDCILLDCAKITFGHHVFVAPRCNFFTAGHPISPSLRSAGVEFAKPIHVGNHVWIGGNVTILPGVNIGDHVVIGAGAVVNKDIPANVIAAGNPCRIIRELTQEELREAPMNYPIE